MHYQPSLRFNCITALRNYFTRSRVLSHSSEQKHATRIFQFSQYANCPGQRHNCAHPGILDEYLLHWPSLIEADLSTLCVKETYCLRG